MLLCTVGGAHQPIFRAIGTLAPRYVCFFCTDRDPDTGRPGCIVQVTGKGNIIKAGVKRIDAPPEAIAKSLLTPQARKARGKAREVRRKK